MVSYWNIPKMWTGDCWIIGGGPSMLQQFDVPSGIIGAVEKGELPFSTYSQYLAPLHSKNVIGTNMAFKLGEWISVLYFCDSTFYRLNHKAIAEFRNLKVTCASHLDRGLLPGTINIKRLKRDYKSGLSFQSNMICWNHNTGAASINFAILAGAKRIFLLGFDMLPSKEKTHWHNFYSVKTPKPSFDRFLKRFPDLAKVAKKNGIEILNVSPNSAIDCFPKVALKDVL